jgi:SAM-dependent methyltransferase
VTDFYQWQIDGSTWEIYDDIFVPAMTDAWALRLADLADLQPGERVLDVACGTGVWALHAAARVGPHGRVAGLDINPDMLAVARRKQNAGAVEWREGSADALPFDDASFDLVCCQLGLMFFPDRVAALSEMRRVLVPGGRFVGMVWGRMEHCPSQMAVTKAWTRRIGPDAAGGFHFQHVLADKDEVAGLLAAAGFRDIDTHWETGQFRFPTTGQYVRSYAALMGLQVEAEVAEALIEDVTNDLAPYVGPDGVDCPIEAVVASARG